MIGRTLGHYRVVEKIGAGGMGEVYRARDERLERDVAVKVLPAGTLADEAARKRFRKEALALSKLNHPNIATIFDFDTQQGVDYLVMEHISGETLADKLKAGPLPESQVLRVGAQVAEGLEAGHREGIVHRDIKPGNLRLTPDGRVKILDFGLAKAMRPASEVTAATTTESLTQTQAIVGTLPYMAPEQLRGEPIDARSDIYAAGAVLYEMATGQRPFPQTQAAELTGAILHQAPRPPRELHSRCSPGFERIILKALAKDPGERYQRAAEARAALEAIATGAVAPWVGLKYALGRRRALAITAGVVLLVVAAVALNFGNLRERLFGIGPAKIDAIAVLPLANLSGDPEQDYLAEGMHEALITDLAKLSGLRRVIARTSVMRYRGTDKPLPQIARELGVDAVITGSVVREGDRVRITAQLINARTEEHVWAERYERDLRDVLTLQNEIVSSIARQIELKLTPADAARLARAHRVNPEAYEFYLRGRFHSDKRTPESLKKGLEYFQAAIDSDPAYALGYVGLADTYRLSGSYAVLPPDEAYPRAKTALVKALELDDTLAEAHNSLANAYYDDFDWEAAEREFQRALELNRNYPTAHHQYAVYLGSLGRHEEAIKEIKRARELDPLSPVIRGAQLGILFHARKYDETIEEGEKALEAEPPFLYFHKGAAYIEKRMFDKGVAEFEQQAVVSPSPAVMARVGYAYARAGRRAEAVKIVSELEQLSKREYVSSYDIALVYAGLGDKTESLAWLERAYENKEGVMWLHFLRVSPCFDGLRDDPRFQDLLRRMNFPD